MTECTVRDSVFLNIGRRCDPLIGRIIVEVFCLKPVQFMCFGILGIFDPLRPRSTVMSL